jgi:hypothetical protein
VVAPTAANVRGWSKIDFDALGYTDDATLQVLVDRAVANFYNTTGRPVDSSVPTELAPLVEQAIQGLTEQAAYRAQEDNLETLSDFDLISSFNAGPYSETRRSPDEMMKARMINAWPWLNRLLWDLLTPDKYDYWVFFFSGQLAPAFAITEVNWFYTYVNDPNTWGA